MSDIRQAIKDFVTDHLGDTTSLPVQWENVKCVLRGLFIKHGARLKKIRGHKISLLIKDIIWNSLPSGVFPRQDSSH